jgi:hypothetical protein
MLFIVIAMFLVMVNSSVYADKNIWRGVFIFNSKMANTGDIDAMFRLGELYEEGTGTDQDINEAINWYKTAADNGHSQAKVKYNQLMAKLSTPKKNTRHNISTGNKPQQAEQTNSGKADVQKDQELAKAIALERAAAEKARAEAKKEAERARQEAEKVQALLTKLKAERETAAKQDQAAETKEVETANKIDQAKVEKTQIVPPPTPHKIKKQSENNSQIAVQQSTKNHLPESSEKSIAEHDSGAAKNAKSNSETPIFKANPCDSPAARFMSSCL